MSRRKEQVESTLMRTIAQVLQRQISDPRIVGLVSITRVKVSPDMKEAYVYVSVMPQKYESKTLHGLRHATGHIHGLVCKLVALRQVPRLDFRLDESLKKQAAVELAIRDGLQRTGEPQTQPTDAETS
jgi:ribosome-binding factor A